uniref:Brain-enriched guanylate kinase-associated protein n=1 Tax=Oncorhynchus tshawytscha TaxID=74940 RepID=A0AAZ3RW70_ONCTS
QRLSRVKYDYNSQHHEDEKRALSREIIVLNNHLMEAKITIEKLREDNDLYRKDCNLAAQLLQCSKSHHRAHKLSELPIDFQERVSSHMEKQGRGVTMALCHSPYSDAVPTAVIAKVLEKPEPGSSCPNTRSPSPHAGGGTESLRRRTAYRTSDLYCSDTALYCPERWQERRQSVDVHARPMGLLLQSQNSTDSNPEEEAFHSGNFSHHGAHSFHGEFAAGSLRASSSYSSFSQASEDEKGGEGCGGGPSSTMSSSHHGLYMDWRDGGYGERKSTSSYEKDSPPGHSVFPKSHSFQHMAMPPSPSLAKGGGGSSPAYVCTRSDSQASMVSMGVPTEEELTGRWRQLSVEDINSYSFNRNPGRVSPYSFSEQHFAMGPAKIKLGPLYSSFHEGDDNVFLHSHVLDQCLAAAASGGLSPSPSPSPKHPSLGLQDSECSLSQQYQKFGSTGTGLSRKDSLTKAQLYGTLLN